MSSGTKVIVTGSSGFIGSHLVKKLMSEGYDVHGYDLELPLCLGDSEKGSISAVEADVTDRDLQIYVEAIKPRWIVHLAAQVFLKPSLENPMNDARINILGTLNVLEAARKNKCGVIFSSSGAVYGNNYQYPEPISPYGISKLTAERYCELYNRLYGVPAVIFRFSSVYGKGRKKTSINLILEKAMNGEVVEVTGTGKQTRDFTHVSDVVDAIYLAVQGRFPSGTYDIGTSSSTSINELINLIEHLLNKKVTVQYIPGVEADPKRNELNVAKAAIVGFKAKVSLLEGLSELIKEMDKW